MRHLAIAIVAFASVHFANAQQFGATPAQQASLKAFLRDYVKDPSSAEDRKIRYVDAWIDLNGDGAREVIVYLSGRHWCGTGGCPTLILASEHSSRRLITKVFITRPPIRVWGDVSHGWQSIGVWVQGGGIQPATRLNSNSTERSILPIRPCLPLGRSEGTRQARS